MKNLTIRPLSVLLFFLFACEAPEKEPPVQEANDLVGIYALYKPKDKKTYNKCLSKCNAGEPAGGILEWRDACKQYCNCRDKGSAEKKCSDDFKEDTGNNPPDVGLIQCSECTRQTVRLKTCTKPEALGENEDLTLTFSCDREVDDNWQCGSCFPAISYTQECCIDSDCEQEFCREVYTLEAGT